jgi:sulfite dehydrogenase (cytochrome) subunit B
MIRRFIVALLLAALMAAPAAAEEKPIDLKKAPGVDKAKGHCAACHSHDYIEMNSPFLTSVGWDAWVTKMIRVFGAPIDDGDAKVIGDYLKTNYGG